MKKIFLIFPLLIAFIGCEKDYDTVVQPAVINYQVTSITSFPLFQYFPDDSTESVFVVFNSTNDITTVTYNLFSPSNERLTTVPVVLTKTNDRTYSGNVTMRQSYIKGIYTLRYYVTDKSGKTSEAAVHNFTYDNGSTNQLPVIANASIEPDSIVVTDTTFIRITLDVSDPDGPSDIELVYFITYRPNGTTSGNQFFLFDEGIKDPAQGLWDEVAGDGIYSGQIFVDQNSAKGTWRFEFRARDRSKELSNIISYNVLIQ
jgi:hypothetical protein